MIESLQSNEQDMNQNPGAEENSAPENNPSENTNSGQTEPEANSSENTPQAEPAGEATDASSAVSPDAQENSEAAPDQAEASEGGRREKGPRKPKRSPEEEAAYQAAMSQSFGELEAAKSGDQPVEVEVRARIKGGLRAFYHNVPLFLPASHFSLKRTPREEELTEAVGQKMQVFVHEISQDEQGRKTVVVTRRPLLQEDFWNRIKVGDVVEGKVTSVASFGVFLDLGGVEGLIHVSRLAHHRVEDPNQVAKRGDTMRAVVTEVNRDKNRIGLSRKDVLDSPWTGVEQQYPAGSRVTGKVMRVTNFGAYVQLREGVEGLLRVGDISWTERVTNPADVLTPGQEIEAVVLNASETQKQISLGLKQAQENPWSSIATQYPPGSETKGVVKQATPQGAIVTVGGNIDGFMPRSKMGAHSRGNTISLKKGDEIDVVIVEASAENSSLILAAKGDENASQSDAGPGGQQQQRRDRPNRESRPRDNRDKDRDRERNPGQRTELAPTTSGANFSFLDLLSEEQRRALMGDHEEEETKPSQAAAPSAEKPAQEKPAQESPAQETPSQETPSNDQSSDSPDDKGAEGGDSEEKSSQ